MSNYTSQELRTCADAKDAKDAGRPVEEMHPSATNGKWRPLGRLGIIIDGEWRYRPAPTPEVIPWTRETLPPLPVEVKDVARNRYTIVHAHEWGVHVAGYARFSYSALLKEFTRPDNSPCGEVKA